MFLDTEEVKYRMKIEGMTAADLAERVGISRQSMYNLLNRKSQPRPSTLSRLCAVLNGSPETLLENNPYVPREYEHIAEIMVDRYSRELDKYDVKASVTEYVSNWLYDQYGNLTREEFARAKEEADREGGEFAYYMQQLFVCFEILGIMNTTQIRAVEEAFTSFFDNMPGMVDVAVNGFDPDGESSTDE